MPADLISDVGLSPSTGTSHNWLVAPDPVTTSRRSSPNQVSADGDGRLGPSGYVLVSQKPLLSCRIAASSSWALVPVRTIIATRLPSGATRRAVTWSAPDGCTETAGVCPLRSTQTPCLCLLRPVTQRSPRLSQLSEVIEIPVGRGWSCPSVCRWPSPEVARLPVYSVFAGPPRPASSLPLGEMAIRLSAT